MFWSILRNIKYWLIYKWDQQSLYSTIDQSEAMVFWRTVKDKRREAVKIKVYGKEYSVSLPIREAPASSIDNSSWLLPQEPVDITEKLNDYLVKNANWKIISDTILWVWQAVLKKYNVMEWMYFKEVFVSGEDNWSSNLSWSKPLNKEAQAMVVLMKEELDWYYMRDDYKLKVKMSGITEEVNFNLKSDIEVEAGESQAQQIWKNWKLIIKDNYTNALRQIIFSTPDWDHPLLQRRQYDLIKRAGHQTVFTCCRRSWKTMLMAFLILRAMFKHNPKRKYRPISVLYISLTYSHIEQVLYYIRKMINSFWEIWEQIFHYDSKYNILSFRQWKDTLAVCNFLSAQWEDPWVWYFADEVFIDEAHLISKEIRDWVSPIVTHEWARLRVASTMYEKIRKWWFYELLTEYEKHSQLVRDVDRDVMDMYEETGRRQTQQAGQYQTQSESESESESESSSKSQQSSTQQTTKFKQIKDKFKYAWLRYDIDQVEDWVIPVDRKESIKSIYSKTPQRYLTELYCRFPDEWKIFKYETSITKKESLLNYHYDKIVIAYDPALRWDKSALVVAWYCSDTKKIHIIDEYTLNKADNNSFKPQIEQIKKIIENARKINPKIFFVQDSTWTQRSIIDLLNSENIYPDLTISYHWWDKVTENDTATSPEHKVPKKNLVAITKILFDNDKLILSMELTNLIKQLDSFYEIVRDNWSVVYAGQWENDDHVNALMMANYFLYEYLNLKYDIIKSQIDTTTTWEKKLTRRELAEYNDKKRNIDWIIADDNSNYYRRFVY